MKKLLCLGISLVCVLTLVACGSESKSNSLKIGIVQIVDHPSLNTIRESMIKELEAEGYKDGDNLEIIYKNAGGDMSSLNTIVKQFKEKDVNVVVAIATPSAMAAANVADTIPVVFSAVSDPVGSRLISDLKKPDKNITGTSDEIQVDKILDLAIEMYPETKKIGFLYNSGEANSKTNLEKAEAYAKAHDLEIIKGPVTTTGDVQTSTQILIDQSDIIFAPNDNTIASAMDLVSSLTKDSKHPLFVGADSMVNDGGLATFGINYEDLGKETAHMVKDILNGKDVKDIPVKVFKDNLNVYINETTAKAIGFQGLDKLKENHDTMIVVK